MRCFCIILLFFLTTLTGCKADKCEELPAQAQINVKLEGIAEGGGYSSLVTLNINDENEVARSFLKASPSFVFAFGELDQPPRTLVINVTVSDKDGKTLGTGELETTFSSNGCNFLTVVVKSGGLSDAGIDGAVYDGGLPDGPVVDVSELDGAVEDASVPDLPPLDTTVDALIPDATVDQPPPDTTVDQPSPDIAVDLPTPDSTVDMPLPDIDQPDMALPDAPLPDVGPFCGDGSRNADEQCEGSDLDGETCETQGFDGGSLACKGDCTFDTADCYQCGDGLINGPSEVCDGTSLGVNTCKTQGFYDGTLKCSADCKSFDTSECHDCGNGLINPGEKCDGLNFGGKTCQTYALANGDLTCESDCSAIVLTGCSNPGYLVIAPGTFAMGSPTSEPCREPGTVKETQHQVTLTHGLEISIYETTQGEFQAVLGYNPSSYSSCGTDCPLNNATWHEAAGYCNALSTQAGLAQCYNCSGSGTTITCQDATTYSGQKIFDCPGYRLLTEAEWEYAYRAGSTTALYPSAGNDGSISVCSGDIDPNADKIGWYRYNSTVTYPGCYDLSPSGPACAGPHPVGQKAPNAWGLYDLPGNIGEWCHDWHQDDLGSSAVTNPWGAASGSYRVVRGASWASYPEATRAARRGVSTPTWHGSSVGFRCGRSLP